MKAVLPLLKASLSSPERFRSVYGKQDQSYTRICTYSIGVYSPRFQATQSCEITLCKYTVLAAILLLHRGVQARVSALFFVSPMKCKSLIVGFLVGYDVQGILWNCICFSLL